MKRLAIALAALCLAILPATASADTTPLNFDDAATFVVQVDALLDAAGPVSVNPNQLAWWAAEITPWFAEEGINPDPITAFTHYEWQAGTDANHILGYTRCVDRDVRINARYANPVSPWYGDPGMIVTIAHELTHVQQADNCFIFSSEQIESSANLAAFEIAAAMANNGSRAALMGVLEELRDIALSHLRYESFGSPEKTASLDSLYAQLFTPAELAERAQRRKFWTKHQAEWKDIIFKYSEIPYRKLRFGLHRGFIRDLILNPGRPATLEVDDLQYVLAHAGELLGVQT